MSLVPDAIDGLVAAVKTAATATTSPVPWQVLDGPPAASVPQAFVCVAFTGQAGQVAVQEVVADASAANPRRAEKVYEITSQLSRYAGNGDVRTQRQECYRLVRAIEAQVLADPKFGGAIQGRATWAGSVYSASITPSGPEILVEFTIRVRGFES